MGCTRANLFVTCRMVMEWRLGLTTHHLQVAIVMGRKMVLASTHGPTVLNMLGSGFIMKSTVQANILVLTTDGFRVSGMHQRCMALDVMGGQMVVDMTASMLMTKRTVSASTLGWMVVVMRVSGRRVTSMVSVGLSTKMEESRQPSGCMVNGLRGTTISRNRFSFIHHRPV